MCNHTPFRQFIKQMQHQKGDDQSAEEKQPVGQVLTQKNNEGTKESQRMQNEIQAEPNIPQRVQLEDGSVGMDRNFQEGQVNNDLHLLDHAEDLLKLNPNQQVVYKDARQDPQLQEETPNNQMIKLFQGKARSKWNRQFGKKKGRFSAEEEKIINEGIRQFLAHYEITHDDFIDMLCGGSFTKSLLSQHDFFKAMSNLLPGRCTYSCYSYIKRNFNKDIKKGRWSIQEQAELLRLVSKYGNKWTKIGEEIGRSATDVSLKYQTLGCKNAPKRAKGNWKLNEIVRLLIKVEQTLGFSFIDPDIKNVLAEQEEHNMKDHLDRQHRAYNSKQFQHHNDRLVLQYLRLKIRQIPVELIPWAKIGNLVKTRSMIDCKNKFLQLLEMALKTYKVKNEGIIEFIQGQAVLEECEIDWQRWQGHDMNYQQAKNRFLFLKKLVINKSHTQFLDQIIEIKQKLKRNDTH